MLLLSDDVRRPPTRVGESIVLLYISECENFGFVLRNVSQCGKWIRQIIDQNVVHSKQYLIQFYTKVRKMRHKIKLTKQETIFINSWKGSKIYENLVRNTQPIVVLKPYVRTQNYFGRSKYISGVSKLHAVKCLLQTGCSFRTMCEGNIQTVQLNKTVCCRFQRVLIIGRNYGKVHDKMKIVQIGR